MDTKIIPMGPKWLFEQLNAHHFGVVGVLDYTADYETGGEFC